MSPGMGIHPLIGLLELIGLPIEVLLIINLIVLYLQALQIVLQFLLEEDYADK